MQGAQVRSLVRELDPKRCNKIILHASVKTWYGQINE